MKAPPKTWDIHRFQTDLQSLRYEGKNLGQVNEGYAHRRSSRIKCTERGTVRYSYRFFFRLPLPCVIFLLPRILCAATLCKTFDLLNQFSTAYQAFHHSDAGQAPLHPGDFFVPSVPAGSRWIHHRIGQVWRY